MPSVCAQSERIECSHQGVPCKVGKGFLEDYRSISDFIQGYWWLLIVVGIGAFFGIRKWVRTKGGRRTWHRWKITMPLFGRVNRLVAVSRFCRTLSTLLDSGVPILTAVSIVKNVVENDILADAIATFSYSLRILLDSW